MLVLRLAGGRARRAYQRVGSVRLAATALLLLAIGVVGFAGGGIDRIPKLGAVLVGPSNETALTGADGARVAERGGASAGDDVATMLAGEPLPGELAFVRGGTSTSTGGAGSGSSSGGGTAGGGPGAPGDVGAPPPSGSSPSTPPSSTDPAPTQSPGPAPTDPTDGQGPVRDTIDDVTTDLPEVVPDVVDNVGPRTNELLDAIVGQGLDGSSSGSQPSAPALAPQVEGPALP